MKSKSKKRWIIGVCLGCVLVLLGGITVYLFRNVGSNKVNQEDPDLDNDYSQASEDTIRYQGNEYVYNQNLTNILFMGIDKKAEMVLKEAPGTAGQADAVMLLSLNKESQTAEILQISRDTMTDIDIYDVSGDYYTSVWAQLATQYAYGNGKQSSCWVMKKTTSRLLYDLPIDAYVSLNMESIHTLNDALGGVTLTIPEDYTDVDPVFEKGAVVTLNGEQAERYVRYRDIDAAGSNNSRMERQSQYLAALLQAVKTKAGNAVDSYDMFYALLEPYMTTDLNAEDINALAKYHFDENKTVYVPGEVKQGEKYEEFYVDDEKLRELLIKKFYKLKLP